MNDLTDRIAAELARSRKYRHLAAETIRRVAAWAAERGGSEKEAVKRAKRKLHQVYAAYCAELDPASIEARLDALGGSPSPAELAEACREILAGHASTRERLPLLETLYPRLWQVTGPPRRLLDLACGLHPFALPWMALPADCEVVAWDIDRRLTDLAGRLLALTGQPGRAECRDLLVGLPTARADVALLFKALPCLEQQEPDAAWRVLSGVPADWVVVSYPTATLGGARKNLLDTYATRIAELTARGGWPAVTVDEGVELVVVVDKR